MRSIIIWKQYFFYLNIEYKQSKLKWPVDVEKLLTPTQVDAAVALHRKVVLKIQVSVARRLSNVNRLMDCVPLSFRQKLLNVLPSVAIPTCVAQLNRVTLLAKVLFARVPKSSERSSALISKLSPS